MAQGLPLATWTFEAQQRAQNQELANQNAMAQAQLLSRAAAVNPPPPTQGLPPTHDWQHSDDLAAHRAMGLEKQRLDASLDKDKMAYQMQLRARYAHHAGAGGGPLSKLLKEYSGVWDRTDFPTPEHQKARLTELTGRIKGIPGGARELANLREANMLPEHYGAPLSKGDRRSAADKAIAEDRTANRQANERRAQAAALAPVLREKTDFTTPEDQAKAVNAAKDTARKRLMEFATGGTHDVLVRDKKTGQVMQYVPDDEDKPEE